MFHLGDVWDVAEACPCLAARFGTFITGEVPAVSGGR